MKNLFFAIATLVMLGTGTVTSFAQTDEARNKVQLTVVQGGKTITTDLNSVSTSLTRYQDNEIMPETKPAAKDTAKTTIPAAVAQTGSVYLTMEAKKLSPDFLAILAKSKTRFDGTITVTDSYGRNPVKIIKFKQAALYSYSDQFSAASYNDNYGSAVLSIICKDLSIDGINFEQ